MFTRTIVLAALWCALLPVVMCPSPAMAQQGSGLISGHLTDSVGGVLQGARVELQPSGASAVSNNQGEFTFTGVAPGAYKLTASFVGLATSLQDVTVAAGQTARVDVALTVESTNELIIVTAERPHGEAEAINRMRTAENILQVLPHDVIVSLPNANVADAIGRLPSVTLERDEGEGKYVQIRGTEPRFSNVTVDGVNVPSPESGVRQVKLDVIPSDLVESVEINKTLLANQDGDAIGGSVNLRTKTAGEQPSISLFGLGGYTPISSGRGADQFGGTIGRRFGKDKRLGVLFGGTYDWNGRGINDIEPSLNVAPCDPNNCGNPSANAPNFPTYSGIDYRDYRYDRTRYGFAGSVDYKLSDNSSVYARALYSHFDNFGDRWVYSPSINSYTTSALQGGTDGSMSSNAQIRRPVQVIGSFAAGGRHFFGTSWITWEVAAARAATEDQGYSTANFGPVADNSPLNNVLFGLNLANPNRPQFNVQNGVNIYDPKQYYLQNLDMNRTYSPQLNLQGAVSFGKNYNWNGHSGAFEMGVKARNAHKFQDANDVYYNAANPGALPMSNFLGSSTDPNYYDKSYTVGPFVDYSKVTSLFASNAGAFTEDFNRTQQRNNPNNWDLNERVSAGYLMNSINFGRFRLYTGLRFEATNLDVLGYHVTLDSHGNYFSTSPLTRNSSYLDPLPTAELRYNITSESAIRLAFGRGIARPNFGDLPPFLVENDKKQSISVGNPDLKATHANNFDLLYEHYLKPLGMIQAGVFYKNITDPIYAVNTTVAAGAYSGFQQTQSVNGSSGYVWGFEMAYQQRLSFLPGMLGGAGISANYSYTDSRAHGVPGRTDSPTLQRQAPHTWNVSPTYDRGRLSLRAGITYNAANLFQYNYQDGAPLGLKGPNGDVYLYAHLQVDAQASVRLEKGFSVVVSGLNLNNEVFGFYQGSPIYPIQREYYKPTIAAGVRWNSSANK
jgi:TonB-dependent receptor